VTSSGSPPGARRTRTTRPPSVGLPSAHQTAPSSASVAPPQLRDELILKVFAGADPAALAPARLDWHRGKLAELQGYLDEVRAAEGWEGSERTLVVGVAYHRLMIGLIEELGGRA
jgi:hypothetical protein